MSAYFITGTGTDVGKTYITASLARQLPNIQALKPVISGYSDADETDTHILLKAQKIDNPDAISPWRFAAPLSPPSAARREGKEISFPSLVEWCRRKIMWEGVTLIEGAGGVMAPLTERHTMLDWIAALRIPVIFVGGSYLGAISHMLTGIAVLKARNLPIHCVVISESETSPMPMEETAQTIEQLSGIRPILVPRNGTVPLSVLP